ncbi:MULTISPECIES: hypothetical protein [Streptococcus]|jgi:hypothetical protein|uniref:hypothetical protein n=1 Tax=Streptococcus TaxID=1301 RepID=UPI0005B381E6|nr:hypothetical protein [Streptococcus salivarius]
MKYIVIDKGCKINTLEYNTFEINEYKSGETISESQEVNLSIKSGVNKENELKRIILLDILVEGKHEDILLRNLHLDLFYEFEYKKKYEESIFSHLDMYMIKHFLIEINKIVETISSLDQETSFSLKEAISDVSKKIPDDLSVSVE